MCCGAGLFPLFPFQYGVEFEFRYQEECRTAIQNKIKIKRNMGIV